MWSAYPPWLNPGDNAWQLTAATLVGLMSVPGLVVLYGGVMQKRWSVNSMMMAFIAFALVLVAWVLFGFKMAFGEPIHILGAHHSIFGNPDRQAGIDPLERRRAETGGHTPDQHRSAVPLPHGDARSTSSSSSRRSRRS